MEGPLNAAETSYGTRRQSLISPVLAQDGRESSSDPWDFQSGVYSLETCLVLFLL